MNILVVENEKPAAEKIIRLLRENDRTVLITGVLETVIDTINWFQTNPDPDLIFMDIQLDDGLCFEIFENINIENRFKLYLSAFVLPPANITDVKIFIFTILKHS